MKKHSMRAEDYMLIEKYSPVVYRMAYSMVKNTQDAEDIHQEVFLKYLAKRPEFEGEEHTKAWFLRVTINLAKNMWKTAWRQRVVSLGDVDREETEAQQEEDKLIETVKRLPQKYRTVVHLFYYEEYSLEEIADILKAKPSTVRTWLTRARQKLKELLKEDEYVSRGL